MAADGKVTTVHCKIRIVHQTLDIMYLYASLDSVGRVQRRDLRDRLVSLPTRRFQHGTAQGIMPYHEVHKY